MFVISLVCKGQLRTLIVGNANDAVKIANQWYKEKYEECAPEGYIAIDQQTKKHKENTRFAEIHFDQSPDEVKLFLNGKSDEPIFKSKYAAITSAFLVSFLEYALIRLTDYLKERNRKPKE